MTNSETGNSTPDPSTSTKPRSRNLGKIVVEIEKNVTIVNTEGGKGAVEDREPIAYWDELPDQPDHANTADALTFIGKLIEDGTHDSGEVFRIIREVRVVKAAVKTSVSFTDS